MSSQSQFELCSKALPAVAYRKLYLAIIYQEMWTLAQCPCVFFLCFPSPAHLWAPDEVNLVLLKQSRRPTHFHPAQHKKKQ